MPSKEPAVLRPALPGDEDFVKALYASTRDDLLAAAAPPLLDLLIDMQWRARRAGYARSFPAAEDAIIEAGGVPVGRLLVDRSLRPWRIVDIALLPAARGRGHGTAAIRSLQRSAAAARTALALSVRRDNPDARRLYLALGFVPRTGDDTDEELTWNG